MEEVWVLVDGGRGGGWRKGGERGKTGFLGG